MFTELNCACTVFIFRSYKNVLFPYRIHVMGLLLSSMFDGGGRMTIRKRIGNHYKQENRITFLREDEPI
jgi:hypothetical protein